MLYLPQARQPGFKQGFARSASASAYPNRWKGLIGAWVPALGPAGVTLRDVSVKKNHGTLTNMAPASDWVIGGNSRLPGYVLDFDKLDDHINVPDADYLTPSSAAMTHIVWLKLRNFSGSLAGKPPGIMAKFDESANQRSWLFGMADDIGGANEGKLRIVISSMVVFFSGAVVLSNLAMPLNVWTQIVSVWDGAARTVTFYIGGKDVGSTVTAGTVPVTVANNTLDMVLGAETLAGGADRTMDGQIGLALLYDRALNAAEIWFHYETPLGIFQRRPITISKAPAAAAGTILPQIVTAYHSILQD